ncbi:MAG TPA: hypothetical protein VKA19_06480 [Alphaproteobacteria bacterium]|nr:hypothetical protein [Alphaproteobacteria bacterium]
MAKDVAKTSDHSGVTLSQKKRRAFLEVLSRTGKVVAAARAVGYRDSAFLRRVRNNDEEFAKEWDDALEAAADRLEDEAVRRAVEGVYKPVYYKGSVVGYEIGYSDQLLMFLLKGARPKKFADRKHIEGEINGKIGVALLPMTAPSIESWEQQAAGVHQKQEADRITIDTIDGEFVDITPKSDQGTELTRR